MTSDVDPEDLRAMREIMEMIIPPIALPEPGETAIVSLTNSKVASLFFDRVWSFGKLPSSVQLYCGQELEQELYWWVTFKLAVENLASYQVDDVMKEKLYRLSEGLLQHFVNVVRKRQILSVGDSAEVFLKKTERTITNILHAEAGIAVPELYDAQSNYERQYEAGKEAILVASLSNLRIVDEGQLQWDQVLEFRKDRDARRKFRRVLHWLDRDMVGKSQAFVQDEISAKLEDYAWAIKKHGLKTAIGTLTCLLSSKSLLMTAGSAAAAGMLGGPLGAFMGAAGTLVGKYALSIAERLVELEDYKRSNPEVAFIHELKTDFGSLQSGNGRG